MDKRCRSPYQARHKLVRRCRPCRKDGHVSSHADLWRAIGFGAWGLDDAGGWTKGSLAVERSHLCRGLSLAHDVRGRESRRQSWAGDPDGRWDGEVSHVVALTL